MHSEVLQRWITIRSGAATTIVQDEEDWLDVGDCPDATFWVDVREVTNPGANQIVSLYLDTAPAKDESLFTPVASWVGLAATSVPTIMRTARGAASVVPLARWLRWRLVASASASWDVSFRLRVARSRSSFFTPMQVSGCLLWLRSDLGVTLRTGTNSATVSSWADQSGNGNNATWVSTSNVVPYSATGGPNNLPQVNGTSNTGGNAGVLTNGSFPASGNFSNGHTLFNVNSFTASTLGGAFSATTANFVANTAFSMWQGAASNAVGRVSLNGTNGDSAGTTVTGTGIFSTASPGGTGNVDIYINGVLGATPHAYAFVPGTTTAYLLFAQGFTAPNTTSGALGNPSYEFLVYNRVLSTVERKLVHRYLGGRYSIAVP